MKKNVTGQVSLSKLIFTHNWEDPAMDEIALRIQPGETVFTITSGCCNTLGFLRFSPGRIWSVDINPAQDWLMELKKSAFRHLGYQEMIAFFGMSPSNERLDMYRKLQDGLSPEAGSFWRAHQDLIRKGIIMNGRYERFVRIAGWLLRTMQGREKVRRFFKLTSLEQQRMFYEQEWDNRRWRWIFDTMFNKKRLAKKGLVSDYFHFDDGSSSFSESFYRRASHVMRDIPVGSNYFLALYFLGHYLNQEQVPEYLKEQHFGVIRQHIDRVSSVAEDSKFWLEKQPEGMFNAFALSNICELMDAADTHKLFSEVIRTAKPGARIIFRNLMIPREVPDDLRQIIVKDEELSRKLQYEDRSFVYGKVAAYTVEK
jgi:S-adenosylmethionine-diacylglycerol 3-amino-3-carboxypropyl transferase